MANLTAPIVGKHGKPSPEAESSARAYQPASQWRHNDLCRNTASEVANGVLQHRKDAISADKEKREERFPIVDLEKEGGKVPQTRDAGFHRATRDPPR